METLPKKTANRFWEEKLSEIFSPAYLYIIQVLEGNQWRIYLLRKRKANEINRVFRNILYVYGLQVESNGLFIKSGQIQSYLKRETNSWTNTLILDCYNNGLQLILPASINALG